MRIKLNLGRLAIFVCTLAAVLLFTGAFTSPPLARSDTPVSASTTSTDKYLIPGGMVFGVRFFTEGVLVVGIPESSESPAYAAGVRVNDIILKVNGSPISDADSLSRAVDSGGGKPVEFTCRRNGHEFTVKVTPRLEESGYKTGIWVRDSGAGIGTVTFIDPETGLFGGLGHGICDADTGKPMPLGRGVLLGVNIGGINKGTAGDPGEIRGSFKPEKLGAVTGNTDCGIFGIYADIPRSLYPAIPIAHKNEVRGGKATILCTLENGNIREYDVELSSIDPTANGGRCFTVKVTDPELIAQTGGIVQGMSGSPIIQNGKLVGAVTHVLINDPTRGYGIFIENMLTAAEQ
ncbi:MAG: SpoIVB peptidase [Eubacteriales bacterium]